MFPRKSLETPSLARPERARLVELLTSLGRVGVRVPRATLEPPWAVRVPLLGAQAGRSLV